jgi:chorismate mutase
MKTANEIDDRQIAHVKATFRKIAERKEREREIVKKLAAKLGHEWNDEKSIDAFLDTV